MRKKTLVFITIISILGINSLAFGSSSTIPDSRQLPRLVDRANLLSPSEASGLLDKLDGISERQSLDVIIVTVDSLEGNDPNDYADDFFDYNGYGLGPDYDGILLLLSMEERDWVISTNGYGVKAFTDRGQTYMMDEVLPHLSSGNYYRAFDLFADLSDDFISQAKTNKPYDSNNMPKKPLGLKWIVFSLVGGSLVAFLVTASMKSKLRSVRSRVSARDYLVANSLNLVSNRDIFLYNRVSKTPRPKETKSPPSSSGSTTHRSSSGRSHGGSRGKF